MPQNFESGDYEMCSKTLKNHEIYIYIASTGSSFTPINFLPPFCVVDVEWWVEDQLVIEESFNLKAKSSGTLQPQFWKMGQTVRDFPENSFFSNLLLFYNSSWTETHSVLASFTLLFSFKKVVHTYLNFRAKVHSLFSKKKCKFWPKHIVLTSYYIMITLEI